jgi:MFS family permease
MRLFASEAFSAGSIGIFALNASISGAIFMVAQFLQTVLGQGPLGAGLQMLPWGVAPFLLTPFAGALIDRVGARSLAVGGLGCAGVGLGWIALVSGPATPYVALIAPLVLIGIGMALSMPALTKSVVGAVAPADIGKASGSFSTVRQLGGAFGVAAVVAVFAATGSYSSPGAFSAGFVAAMATTAGLALAGAAAALALPSRKLVPIVAAQAPA